MTEAARIIWYEPLAYQQLGADIGTYHEFCSAFDALANVCQARGQSFERVHIDVPAMQQWLRDNGHNNDNSGRAAFSETLQAIHPDIDYVPPKQTLAAANFGSPLLGPLGLGIGRPMVDWQALPRMIHWR